MLLCKCLKVCLSASDSDDQASSPRRPATSSTSRNNAEGLASHVLHGSLRLTPSRQQILSYSGISLPDGPPKLLDERSTSANNGRLRKGSREGIDNSSGEEEEDDENEEGEEGEEEGEEGEGEAESDEEGAVRRKRRTNTGTRTRRRREDKPKSEVDVRTTGPQLRKANDTYVQQIKKRAHKIQKQKVQRLAADNKRTEVKPLDRRSERTKTATKKALASMKPNEVTVTEAPPADKRRRLRGSYSSTRSAFGSSSSIIDVMTGAEDGSEDRVLFSPLSDPGLYHNRHQKLDTLSVPSASSLEDLTVKSPLQAMKQHHHDRARRTQKNPTPSSNLFSASEDTTSEAAERGGGRTRGRTNRKRTRRDGGSGARKRRRVVDKKNNVLMNGIMNGGEEYRVVLWDLVWAKCRGYPPYPALVSGTYRDNTVNTRGDQL